MIFVAFAPIMVSSGEPLLGLPIVLIAVACGLVIIPPVWQLKKLPQTEYIVTNKRLVIKTGTTKHDVWSTELASIKEIIVKRGIIDRMLATGKLYPITAVYPYAPKLHAYSRNGMNRLKKVYNLTTGVYDEISEIELYRKSISHPHLEGIRQPYTVQRLLKAQI